MVEGIINAFDQTELCLVIILTKGGNCTILQPLVFATGFVLLLCSHYPNDIPPEPQQNVSISAVRGTVCRPILGLLVLLLPFIPDSKYLLSAKKDNF